MEQPDGKTLYKIFQSRDERYDGRFFVGVKTTGIYCRPVCYAKPKEENCVYFNSAAAAEKAGFRPCLLCRPELAPGYAPMDSSRNIANIAKRLLEEKANEDQPIASVCHIIGCSDRHLRRVFQKEFGVTPMEYMQTNRLLLAKKLLTDTMLPVTEIAYASGFGSIRSFNTTFQKRYHICPSVFKKEAATGKAEGIMIRIGYRKPYRYGDILRFLKARAVEGLEIITDDSYSRALCIEQGDKEYKGIITVTNEEKKGYLCLTVSETLLPVLATVITKVKNQFDLYADPQRIYDDIRSINEIVPDGYLLGTRVPGCMDEFELCVRAIIGQLVSVKAARTTLKKIVLHYGEKIENNQQELYLFPCYKQFCCTDDELIEELGPLGITKVKTRAIAGIARYFRDRDTSFHDTVHPDAEIKQLLAIQGIGEWTAQYIAMRTMGNTNILLTTDYAIRKLFVRYPVLQKKEVQNTWSPWKSYVTIGLWHMLAETEE